MQRHLRYLYLCFFFLFYFTLYLSLKGLTWALKDCRQEFLFSFLLISFLTAKVGFGAGSPVSLTPLKRDLFGHSLEICFCTSESIRRSTKSLHSIKTTYLWIHPDYESEIIVIYDVSSSRSESIWSTDQEKLTTLHAKMISKLDHHSLIFLGTPGKLPSSWRKRKELHPQKQTVVIQRAKVITHCFPKKVVCWFLKTLTSLNLS